jgi:hypothetical protein
LTGPPCDSWFLLGLDIHTVNPSKSSCRQVKTNEISVAGHTKMSFYGWLYITRAEHCLCINLFFSDYEMMLSILYRMLQIIYGLFTCATPLTAWTIVLNVFGEYYCLFMHMFNLCWEYLLMTGTARVYLTLRKAFGIYCGITIFTLYVLHITFNNDVCLL